jgi:hypothetical protein
MHFLPESISSMVVVNRGVQPICAPIPSALHLRPDRAMLGVWMNWSGLAMLATWYATCLHERVAGWSISKTVTSVRAHHRRCCRCRLASGSSMPALRRNAAP